MTIQNSWYALIYAIIILQVIDISTINGQSSKYDESDPIIFHDTLHKERLNWLLGIGSVTYLGGSVGLYEAWYKDYPRSSFHFFNDLPEWNQVDKAGHIFSTYAQAKLITKGFHWTGMNRKKSIIYGALTSLLFQSTVEVMDGFSSGWGFSLSDMASNLIGVSIFTLQESLWQEQRVTLKFSSTPVGYPGTVLLQNQMISLEERADILYGSSIPESLLKDYNSHTYWASFNLASFVPASKIPSWLNIAVGYGADNLYGGFSNTWMSNNMDISLDPTIYPRTRQYYLSLDIDTSRITTKSPFIRTLLDLFSVIKIPLPTLEYKSSGQFRLHPLKF